MRVCSIPGLSWSCGCGIKHILLFKRVGSMRDVLDSLFRTQAATLTDLFVMLGEGASNKHGTNEWTEWVLGVTLHLLHLSLRRAFSQLMLAWCIILPLLQDACLAKNFEIFQGQVSRVRGASCSGWNYFCPFSEGPLQLQIFSLAFWLTHSPPLRLPGISRCKQQISFPRDPSGPKLALQVPFSLCTDKR